MKNILMIVPNIPNYHTNAGDWRVHYLCRTLAKRYSVYMLPMKYNWGDDKYEQITRKTGIKIVFPGINNAKRFRSFIKTKNINTVIFRSHNLVPEFSKYLDFIGNIVIDMHELQYEKLSRVVNPGPHKAGTAYISLLEAAKEQEIANLGKADALISISEADAGKIRSVLPKKRIIIIPTPCDVSSRKQVFPAYEKRRNLAFFGLFNSGASNDDAVEYFLAEIFPRIKEKIPGIQFSIIGHNAGIFQSASKDVCIKEDIEDIQAELSKYRVFVCPLRYGAGVKKKIFDSMVSQTPVVTRSVGVEGIDVVNGSDILVADRPEVFASKVVELYTNQELWNKISRNGFEKILRLYSETAVEKSMKKLYDVIDLA